MFIRLLALWLAFAPALAWSADGATFNPTGRSRKGSIIARLLCDSKAAANQSEVCANLRIPQAAGTIIFTLQTTTGCSTVSVIAQARNTTAGPLYTLGTLTLTNNILRVSGSAPEILAATLTTLTDCTDLDVVVEVFQLEGNR